jgi:NAD(P)-dependent dehydrogenase (short-subunit alcohol dehydrogenase family)
MTGLRPELLAGRTVALFGEAPAVKSRLTELGARVESEASGSADAIVYDAAPAFGEGGQAGLRDASARGWTAIRDVATGALIPHQRGGKVVVIAPRPDAGAFAGAARAALESLARTLSVEWARYEITATVITPGNATTDDQIAQLVCFLVSPAGDYFSGCRFSLGVTASAD